MAKKKRQLRKVETVREKSAKPQDDKKRRLSTAKQKLGQPAGRAKNFLTREYYLPVPDTKVGRFLNKKRSFWPKWLKNSYSEVKQVDWPDKRSTFHLSLAVFVFAIFFGALVAVVDWGLGMLFEELIIK